MTTTNRYNGAGSRTGVSRRTWLHAIGAVGASALAGCSSNSTGNGSDSTPKKEMALNETMGTDTIPTDIDWNPYAGTVYSPNTAGYTFEYSGLLVSKTGEVDLLGYDSWNYDTKDNSLSITLADGLKYWNGDPYTADDRLARDLVRHYLSPELWKDIEKVDKRTVKYYYEKPQNPDLLAVEEIHGTLLGLGADVWNPWIDRLENASSQAERDQIQKDLVENFSISNTEFMERGLGTSPYKMTNVSTQGITFKKWDDHRLADQIEVETFRRPYAANQAREDELITNNKVDLGRFPLSGRYKGVIPEYLQNLVTWRAKWLIKMLINWRNRKYLQDANVRRAMAAVISTKDIVTNVGDGYPIKVHSGMDLDYSRRYIGEDTLSNYIDYGTKSKPDLADSFLQKSGYSRQNGSVVDKNGKPLSTLRFLVGSGSQWKVPAETAARQLEEYGFPIKIVSIGREIKLDRIVENENMDSWDLTTESHYAAGRYHPLAYFDYGTFWGWRLGPADFGAKPGLDSKVKRWLSQGKEYSPYNGKPLTPKIPTQVGIQDLSGKTTELNNFDLIKEMYTPVSEKRTKEIIRNLSWAWNFHLPDIDLITTRQGLWADTKHFDWPDDKAPLTAVNSSGVYYATKQGLVGYK
jgi:peptide/nickel transport system substrate-binding protein